MLKNRQSSKPAVNRKRAAPEHTGVEPKPLAEKALPHRSSTFPVQMMQQQVPKDIHNRRQQSLDNTQINNRSADANNQSSWVSTTPELLTETMTTPEHISSTGSMNPSISSQEPSSLAWAQQFTNPANLPDLMPMMFPSDDPFAYPTQPMSTLEDDHFRHDNGMPSQYPFDPSQTAAMGSTTPGDHSVGVSTPPFDLSTLSNFSIGQPQGYRSSVPSHLRPSHSRSSSRIQSPISQSQSSIEALGSPDLVSIPNQNFVWQSYNFQPNDPNQMAAESMAPKQEMSDPGQMQTELPDLTAGMDENMGMNMDLGISFDDLFGNNAAYRPAHASNDEWTQWMNNNT